MSHLHPIMQQALAPGVARVAWACPACHRAAAAVTLEPLPCLAELEVPPLPPVPAAGRGDGDGGDGGAEQQQQQQELDLWGAVGPGLRAAAQAAAERADSSALPALVPRQRRACPDCNSTLLPHERLLLQCACCRYRCT